MIDKCFELLPEFQRRITYEGIKCDCGCGRKSLCMARKDGKSYRCIAHFDWQTTESVAGGSFRRRCHCGTTSLSLLGQV